MATAGITENIPPVCSWGIMGCANIARKVARCMLLADNAKVACVASRSLAKAQAFVAACKLNSAEAIEGYDSLLARADIDAVYIPLPTSLHLEWVVKAAAAGKHVLVEKPVALHAGELDTMLQACADNDVQFMDGVMFMHHQRLQKIDKILRGDPYNAFGDVQRVTSGFSFSGDASFFQGNIRSSMQGDPLGCLGDLGWYCIRFGLFAFGYENPPHSVSARKIRDAAEFSGGEGVPVDMEVSVYFDSAKTKVLSFHCSFCHPFRQWVEVTGQQHTLRLDDFVLAKTPSVAQFTVERNAGLMDIDCLVTTVPETISTFDCVQELEMVKEFSRLALVRKGSGSTTRADFWPTVTATTQRVIDAAMASAAQDGASISVAPAADATLVTTKSGVGGEMVATSSGAIREWPELVGLPGATAVGKIQAEQPQLSEVVAVEEGAMVTMDFREDRVRVFTNAATGLVSRPPTIG